MDSLPVAIPLDHCCRAEFIAADGRYPIGLQTRRQFLPPQAVQSRWALSNGWRNWALLAHAQPVAGRFFACIWSPGRRSGIIPSTASSCVDLRRTGFAISNESGGRRMRQHDIGIVLQGIEVMLREVV